MTDDRVTLTEHDRLYPIYRLLSRSHIDDVPDSLLADIFEQIDSRRITEPDGSKKQPISNPYR